jgi:pimeloyl-ACP methyl ester carboxylesterase
MMRGTRTKSWSPLRLPFGRLDIEFTRPLIAGNRPGDPKTVGLQDAIKSIVDYLAEKNLRDVILLGHGYGGMMITGVADRIPERIRRLVYWNAFVPNNGQSVNDMAPYILLFRLHPRPPSRWFDYAAISDMA